MHFLVFKNALECFVFDGSTLRVDVVLSFVEAWWLYIIVGWSTFFFVNKEWISTFSSWLIYYYVCRYSFLRTRGNISISSILYLNNVSIISFPILSVLSGSTLCAVSWQWYDSIFFDTLNESNGRSQEWPMLNRAWISLSSFHLHLHCWHFF